MTFSEEVLRDIFSTPETEYQRGKNDRIQGLKQQSNDIEYVKGYRAQIDIETAVRENILPTIN